MSNFYRSGESTKRRSALPRIILIIRLTSVGWEGVFQARICYYRRLDVASSAAAAEKKPIIPCYTQPVVTKEVDGGGYDVLDRTRNTVVVDKLKLGPN